MNKLTAYFQTSFNAPLLASHPQDDEFFYVDSTKSIPIKQPLKYSFRIEPYQIEIELVRGLVNNPLIDMPMAHGIKTVIIRVTCEEETPIPTSDGSGKILESYLRARKFEYYKCAFEASKRLLNFFKYKLHNPFISPPNFGHFAKHGIWYDEDGNELGKIGDPFLVVCESPGRGRGKSGLRAEYLNLDNECELQDALVNPIEPSLFDQLLSEAQQAIFQKNYLKANGTYLSRRGTSARG